MPSYIKTREHLSIVFDDGSPLTIYASNPNWGLIIQAVNAQDWDSVRKLADPVIEVEKNIGDLGFDVDRVRLEHGVVFLDDDPMEGLLFDRMVDMATEGFDITALKLFLVNLEENPSYRAVQSLYEFLEKSDLPITEDGHFIAYKRVRSDFTDERSGKFDNSPGQVVQMSRNKVNENPAQTCAAGLHVCSRAYLPSYGSTGGGQVIMVKISPRDVVAIPADYNNTKMRVCRYEVLRALTLQSETYSALPEEKLEAPFVDTRPEQAEDVFVKALSEQEQTATAVRTAMNKNTTLVAELSDAGNILNVWPTAAEASAATGVCSSSIGKVCRGERKNAGGRSWKYVDPTEMLISQPIVETDEEDLLDDVDEERCPDCDALNEDCTCWAW